MPIHAWRRPALAIAALGCALRLLWPMGLDLYGDEAYYYLWSLRPAFGYFDHPPLVAWLARAGTALGHAEVWLRLPFAMCGGLAVFFSAAIASELTDDEWVPTLAAFLLAVAPLPFLASALALPDAPLCAAVAGCTWLVLRGRPGDLLGAGALFGGAMLSKYSAATLIPGFALIALRDPVARTWLRGWEAWAAMGLAALLFAPVVAWNASHGFASFAFQFQHASGVGFSAQTFGAFVGSEFAGAGPFTLLLAAPFLWRADSAPSRRLAALTFVPLVWFGYAALRGKFEANWPVFLDPGLCAAAAAGLSSYAPRIRRILALVSSAGAVATVIVIGLELRRPRIVTVENVDVMRFHEGKALAQAVRARLGEPVPFIFTNDYQDAGELAFYGGLRRLGPALERRSQLDVWNDHPAPGEAFVLLGPAGVPATPSAHFPGASATRSETFALSLDGEAVRSAQLTWFDGFRTFVR